MKSKDVRLGNWVVFYNKKQGYSEQGVPMYITHIGTPCMGADGKMTDLIGLKGEYVKYTQCFNFIFPIIMSEEWAVKWGYENMHELAICFDDDSFLDLNTNITVYKLSNMYVHEVQNLYFSLTRKEL